jgi:hypothetical protein
MPKAAGRCGGVRSCCAGEALVAKGHEHVAQVEAGCSEGSWSCRLLPVACHVQDLDAVLADPRGRVSGWSRVSQVHVEVWPVVLLDRPERASLAGRREIDGEPDGPVSLLRVRDGSCGIPARVLLELEAIT